MPLCPAESNFVQHSGTERVHMLRAEIRVWKRCIVEEVRIDVEAGEVLGRINEVHRNLVSSAELVIEPRETLIAIDDGLGDTRELDGTGHIRHRHAPLYQVDRTP